MGGHARGRQGACEGQARSELVVGRGHFDRRGLFEVEVGALEFGDRRGLFEVELRRRGELGPLEIGFAADVELLVELEGYGAVAAAVVEGVIESAERAEREQRSDEHREHGSLIAQQEPRVGAHRATVTPWAAPGADAGC